ncbi:MAG: heme-binding protein [Burkholderiaceae bacterium]|nr:heme-binding protein [Burkholderiaceae bacterium]
MIQKLLLCTLLSLSTLTGIAMATEEPSYRSILQEAPFEIREYPSLIAAEVTVSGERSEAVSAGFRLLAGYIFGGNTRKQSIAMTAPVIQNESPNEKIAMTAPVMQSPDPSGWIIRFIMPASYTLETLPTPNDPKVRLVSLPPKRLAVVRFSGLVDDNDVEQQTAVLRTFIAKQKLTAIGTPSLARYDPPWTLWFLRRNEVMLEVTSAQ